MSKNSNSVKTDTKVKSYSTDYERIRKEVESKWPDWKVSTYNFNFATSKHSKKVITK